MKFLERWRGMAAALAGCLLVAAGSRAGDLPMSGKAVPALAAFDRAMQQFMQERHIPAGTLAVMRDGRLLLSRGYGFADRQRTRGIAPDAPFRIASVSKPFTAAAVRKLIRDGKLRLDTRVFPLLGISPPRGHKADPRLRDITVEHLLEHRGGWDRQATFDPMFRSRQIADALGIPSPPSARDVIRYMAGQPLQFDPGSRSAYSNFGYVVLGRVIEKVSGRSFIDYLHTAILRPLHIKSVEVGRTLPRDRNPREPFYSDPATWPCVFGPNGRPPVPAPDGGFSVEIMDANGGLIASAPDVARFMNAYWPDGRPRPARSRAHYCVFGSIPGTFAMALWRPDGTNIVVLFNQRKGDVRHSYQSIHEVMNKTADGIKEWPRP